MNKGRKFRKNDYRLFPGLIHKTITLFKKTAFEDIL